MPVNCITMQVFCDIAPVTVQLIDWCRSCSNGIPRPVRSEIHQRCLRRWCFTAVCSWNNKELEHIICTCSDLRWESHAKTQTEGANMTTVWFKSFYVQSQQQNSHSWKKKRKKHTKKVKMAPCLWIMSIIFKIKMFCKWCILSCKSCKGSPFICQCWTDSLSPFYITVSQNKWSYNAGLARERHGLL